MLRGDGSNYRYCAITLTFFNTYCIYILTDKTNRIIDFFLNKILLYHRCQNSLITLKEKSNSYKHVSLNCIKNTKRQWNCTQLWKEPKASDILYVPPSLCSPILWEPSEPLACKLKSHNLEISLCPQAPSIIWRWVNAKFLLYSVSECCNFNNHAILKSIS